jgi:hypothetical protein
MSRIVRVISIYHCHNTVSQKTHTLSENSGLFALFLCLDLHFVNSTTFILSHKQWETEGRAEE